MNETALIEAILYLENEPLEEASLACIAGLSKDAVVKALKELADRYAREGFGVELAQLSNGVMLFPKKEYWNILKNRYGRKNETRLSRAAMETLSIIAYSQPITRSEIEAIRGVSADSMIRLLIEKQFVREVGRKDVPGKPVQLGTTKEFLKQFQLSSIADLPKLDESEVERFGNSKT
ncbi:MAG: SMC-Scp complex subunit ScpB [Treponema sp.]|jgi:segregation and condensation protein B|nr:SMC-Scp complex subunit ScpB [Treponema sp.]